MAGLPVKAKVGFRALLRGMSEHKPISHADLARYWRCSPANVSNLVKRKGMPEFTTLRAADEWRAVNAPIRKAAQKASEPATTSAKNGVEVGKKNVGLSGTTTAQPSTPPAAPAPAPATPGGAVPPAADQLGLPGVEGGPDPKGLGDRYRPPKEPDVMPERIDVSKFIDRDTDFTELMIRQAKELPQIVYGLLRLKTEAGEPGAIAAASKNWHEASGHAADVLERFISIQQASGALLSMDDVSDVILTEMQEVRKNLKKLGLRYAPLANPADPVLAQKIFDAAVDAALAPGDAATERVRLELAPGPEAAAAAS